MAVDAPAPRPIPVPRRGDRGLPVVGRAFDYLRSPVRLMRHQWETYGPVSPLRVIGSDGVMVLGPDACGEVLTNRDKAFANGPAWSQLVGPFFQGGLMLLEVEEHLSLIHI